MSALSLKMDFLILGFDSQAKIDLCTCLGIWTGLDNIFMYFLFS